MDRSADLVNWPQRYDPGANSRVVETWVVLCISSMHAAHLLRWQTRELRKGVDLHDGDDDEGKKQAGPHKRPW